MGRRTGSSSDGTGEPREGEGLPSSCRRSLKISVNLFLCRSHSSKALEDEEEENGHFISFRTREKLLHEKKWCSNTTV